MLGCTLFSSQKSAFITSVWDSNHHVAAIDGCVLRYCTNMLISVGKKKVFFAI